MESGANVTALVELSGNSTPAYFGTAYRVVAITFQAIIFVVGILGNILVVIVVIKTRSMHTTTNCYLLSLAIADCLVLVSATLPAIPENFFRLDEWAYGAALCHILVFIQYMGCASSAMSITAFTVERYIAVCHPLKAHIMCTVKRAKRIIIILWVFTISYSSPWIAVTKIAHRIYKDGTSDERCLFRYNRNNYLAYYMLDMIIFYIFPILITVVLYGLICRTLFFNTSDAQLKNPPHTIYQVSSRNQVIRMLCAVVILFVVLLMPYRVLVVYNSFATNSYIDLWFLLFCKTLVYINSAINPILYNAMSRKFRSEFYKLLCCGKFRQTRFQYVQNYDGTKTVGQDKRVSSAARFLGGTQSMELENMSII